MTSITKKGLLSGEKVLTPSTPKIKYLTFTDLYEMKQIGLEKILLEGYTIYLLSKKMPPLKITIAELT